MEDAISGKLPAAESTPARPASPAPGRQESSVAVPIPPVLARIQSPADLRSLTPEELHTLCDEIREYIVDVVSRKGGHLGSSLGVEALRALPQVQEDLLHRVLGIVLVRREAPGKAPNSTAVLADARIHGA